MQITVEPGLDLVQGDRLALAATSFAYLAMDDIVVDSYNAGTGVVTFSTSILHYHWGAPASTAADYNGVDIRGEVLLLTRNIKIIGEDIESWGGQIVTSDTVDGLKDDGTIRMRSGQLIMDNVEVYNCS